MNQSEKSKAFFLICLACIFYSLVTVFAKKTANYGFNDYCFIIYLSAEFLCLFIYAVLWQQVLKYTPLNIAVFCKGGTVVLSFMWAIFIFGESITLANIIGAMLIVFGIAMVAKNA